MSDHINQNFDYSLRAEGFRFAVIVSRFNSFVTEPLLEGALDGLKRQGAAASAIDVIRIPGAWEFTVTLTALTVRSYDAVICLGAVVRGDTPHFDYVAGEASRGMALWSERTGVPLAFGLLTTDNVEQATDRAGGKHGNKGFDSAMTAIEMANLMRSLRAGK